MIKLAITVLTNGETVTIDKYLDANTNGVIDGRDLLVQHFQVTDGQVSTIGGVTNVNVPGDSNPAAGKITTLLNFESFDVEHLAGSYFFKLSSPSRRFTPVTNAFSITDSAYLQSFTGQVRSNGTATAVANAIVAVMGPNGTNFFGGTVADNSGNYTIKAAPGTYLLVACKSNFVGDFTAAAVTLGTGITVTNNVNAIPATRTISGRVADAGNTNIPLPGIMMVLKSTNGLVALSCTDTNGNFNAPVIAGWWRVGALEGDTALHGYVGLRNIYIDTSTGSVSRVNILLPKATAMYYGSVKDDLGQPLPGFTFYGGDQGAGQYSSFGVTDANGNYAVAALAGTWKAGLDDDNPRFTNYVFSGGIPTTTLTYGQALRSDFVLMLATNHITGYLRDNLNNPIAGVRIHAFADLDRTNRYVGFTSTDGNGNYTLNVANGNWSVACNCGCSSCDYDLTARGYRCINEQEVTISGNNGVANFIAQSSLQATTASLPDGVFNSLYSSQLQASGGQPPYSWSLTPGSAPLPPGLDISSDGTLSGTTTNSGTFYFYVRVTDARSTTADALLVIYIPSPPLQITTLSLPSAQEGLPYTNQLQAFGGQLPYGWSLALGSLALPPDLNLSASGVISGTPATNGTFYFIVRATDANSAFTNRSLGLTINPKLAFTLLNRTGNQFQWRLTGVTEQNYTVQFSTNLASSNWFWLLTTNPSAASVTILDPNATNSSRFYRVRLGP